MPPALLDTDILSEVLRQRNATIRRNAAVYLRQHQQVAFSAITRYEVLRGLKEKQATRQLEHFTTFCDHALIFALTDDVLDRAADLWAAAYRGGHPRNDADLLIAATALEQGRILVTGNAAHFSWVPGLTVENWRQGSS